MPNILRSKANKTLNIAQVIDYNNKKMFLQKSCRKWGSKTSSTLFFKKSFTWGTSKWSAAYFQSLLIALNLPSNLNKIYETLEYWSRNILNFYFLEKGVGIVSLPHFVYNLCVWMFLMLYSINWPNFIGKYVYSICLLTRLWRHRFRPDLSNQAVFLHDQRAYIKI